LWDFCHPRAMLSRDVDPEIESMSWRVSLRVVIVRSEVLAELGGVDPVFDTSAGAGLDVGMRWVRHGALLRHVPDLLAGSTPGEPDAAPSLHDEVRFVANHMGRTWALWASARGAM